MPYFLNRPSCESVGRSTFCKCAWPRLRHPFIVRLKELLRNQLDGSLRTSSNWWRQWPVDFQRIRAYALCPPGFLGWASNRSAGCDPWPGNFLIYNCKGHVSRCPSDAILVTTEAEVLHFWVCGQRSFSADQADRHEIQLQLIPSGRRIWEPHEFMYVNAIMRSHQMPPFSSFPVKTPSLNVFDVLMTRLVPGKTLPDWRSLLAPS